MHWYDNDQTDEGAAFVYIGSATGLNTVPAWIAEGNQDEAGFGCSVATAGDVNGDGYSDVIVGALQYHNGQELEGAAFVFTGSASGLSTTPAWMAEGDQEGAWFGYSVATAGDVNGDGYSDVIASAIYYSNPEIDEGAAFVYYGGGGPGVPLRSQQLRADASAPIAPLGRAGFGLFKIASIGRTPFGRGDVKLQWQVAPLGGTFDPAINPVQSAANWSDSGVTGTELHRTLLLDDGDGPYIWRMRTKYNPVNNPFQGHGPWLTLAANGLLETDLRRVHPCVLPDEACWLYSVVKSGTDYTLNWQDPNQPDQRTGWNIRRSNDPGLAKDTWLLIGTNVVDMDAGTPNYQYTDFTGDAGDWYYQVTTYNANCPAEGPF
jgi:hypothetical protein